MPTRKSISTPERKLASLAGPSFLPCGWFLDDGDPELDADYKAELLVPFAIDQERGHGPAKWDGRPGPRGSALLLTIMMRDFDAWYAAMEALQYGEDVPDPGSARVWPGQVTVTPAGMRHGLGFLEGLVVDSERDFLELIAPVVSVLPPRTPAMYSASERLAHIRATIPGV